MKLVIDIPESSLGLINDETTKIVYEAIRNGTVLPEGHGDLIDRKELKESFSGYTLFTASTVIEHIANAPTVIEADKET